MGGIYLDKFKISDMSNNLKNRLLGKSFDTLSESEKRINLESTVRRTTGEISRFRLIIEIIARSKHQCIEIIPQLTERLA